MGATHPEKQNSLMAECRDKNHDPIVCKSMFDTGNTLKFDCAINHEFHQRLGVGFESIKRASIGTAGKGKSMAAVGVSSLMDYLLKPRVIKN